MAESVLTTVAFEIIKKASSSVVKDNWLWWGVKDEIEKLERDVSTIQAVLLDAEHQYWENNHLVRTWVASLKDVLYDAEDLLDEFSTMALQRQAMTGNRVMKEVRLFFSHSNRIVYGLKMFRKIRELRVILDEINDSRRNFHLDERPVGEPFIFERRETHSFSPELVIGRENDKAKIVELLSSGEEKLSIVSIVGFGGLGKTVLAQLVYNDDRVKINFEVKAWVCVSTDFNVKLIVEKLLESLTGERHGNSEMERLKNLLREKISGKRFLIVLDDMWNENSEKWSRLRDLLVGGSKGSTLVITTRSWKVVEITHSSIYELQCLSENESWSLLKGIVFKQGQVPSPTHESIGKEIVAKCGGVPLALRSIGGLLYCKDTIEEWESFRDNELSELKLSGNPFNDVLKTLKLSYDNLPS